MPKLKTPGGKAVHFVPPGTGRSLCGKTEFLAAPEEGPITCGSCLMFPTSEHGQEPDETALKKRNTFWVY